MSAVLDTPAVTRTGEVRVRRLTSTMLAAAALAFLLPFGTVSCDGEEVSFTGIELATFSVDQDPDEPDGTLVNEVESNGSGIALVALAVAIIGAAVAARRNRGGGYAVGGLVALFLLDMQAEAILFGPDVAYGAGYLLSFASFAAAGLTRLVTRLRARRRVGERIWTWIVATVLGAPVAAVVIAFLALASSDY